MNPRIEAALALIVMTAACTSTPAPVSTKSPSATVQNPDEEAALAAARLLRPGPKPAIPHPAHGSHRDYRFPAS